MITTLVAALAPVPFALGGGPTLVESGTALGSTVQIDLAGAPALAAVGLLYSPSSSELVLPQGTLELDPTGLELLAVGAADAVGELSFRFPLALNPNLAEAELHLQAFVVEGGVPGGAVLSGAIHARARGSRVYAFDSTEHMLVFSAVNDEPVFFEPYEPAGAFVTEGPMIFNARRSHGAFAYGGDGLRIFDNHFGGFMDMSTLGGVAKNLEPHPDGKSFWALTFGDDRLVRIDFDSGVVVDAVGGLGVLGSDWAANESVTVAAAHVTTGLNRVKLVVADLETGQELATVFAGSPSDTHVRAMGSIGDWIFAVTGGINSHSDSLTQIDVSSVPPTVLTHQLGLNDADGARALRERDEILVWHSPHFITEFSTTPFAMRIIPVGTTLNEIVPEPPSTGFNSLKTIDAIDCTNSEVCWVARRCCKEPPDSDESGNLTVLDVPTRTWTTSPTGLQHGPQGIGVVNDAFGHRVFSGYWATNPPFTSAHLQSYDVPDTSMTETFPVEATYSLVVHRADVVN